MTGTCDIDAEVKLLLAERAALASSAPAVLGSRGDMVQTTNPEAWGRICQINQRLAQLMRKSRGHNAA